jgi:signal peptidase II
MKKRAIILAIVLIVILVFIDQFIKILIANYLLDNQICRECVCVEADIILIANVLRLRPVLNTGFMGPLVNFAALFGIDISNYSVAAIYKTVAVLLSIGIILIFLRHLIFISKKRKGSIYFLFVIYTAGSFCSLIDTIFWGGSLDYILFRFFPYIFDLKDVYLTCSPLFFLPWYISYCRDYYKLTKEERKQEHKETGFIKWIKAGCPLERQPLTERIKTFPAQEESNEC